MKIQITRKNGFRSVGISAQFGEVIEVSESVGAQLCADGVAVAVGAVKPAAESEAPVIAKVHNTAYRNGKKK
jgi:hypothetical protein